MLPEEQRSFAIVKVERPNGVKVNIGQGRYISSTPSGAAKKVYTQVAQHVRKSPGKFTEKLKVHVRESTAGSKHDKVFSYTVKREKLAEPIKRKIDGKTIIHRYSLKAMSLNQ